MEKLIESNPGEYREASNCGGLISFAHCVEQWVIVESIKDVVDEMGAEIYKHEEVMLHVPQKVTGVPIVPDVIVHFYFFLSHQRRLKLKHVS